MCLSVAVATVFLFFRPYDCDVHRLLWNLTFPVPFVDLFREDRNVKGLKSPVTPLHARLCDVPMGNTQHVPTIYWSWDQRLTAFTLGMDYSTLTVAALLRFSDSPRSLMSQSIPTRINVVPGMNANPSSQEKPMIKAVNGTDQFIISPGTASRKSIFIF